MAWKNEKFVLLYNVEIDSIRHGLCNHMGWFYKGNDGKYHDGL